MLFEKFLPAIRWLSGLSCPPFCGPAMFEWTDIISGILSRPHSAKNFLCMTEWFHYETRRTLGAESLSHSWVDTGYGEETGGPGPRPEGAFGCGGPGQQDCGAPGELWHKAWLCPEHRWKQEGADLQASLDKAGGNELPEGQGWRRASETLANGRRDILGCCDFLRCWLICHHPCVLECSRL